MEFNVACLGIIVSFIVLGLSFIIKDEVGVQSTRILGFLIFLFSFPLTPLLVKLAFFVFFIIAWPYFGDRLSMYLYRQIKK